MPTIDLDTCRPSTRMLCQWFPATWSRDSVSRKDSHALLPWCVMRTTSQYMDDWWEHWYACIGEFMRIVHVHWETWFSTLSRFSIVFPARNSSLSVWGTTVLHHAVKVTIRQGLFAWHGSSSPFGSPLLDCLGVESLVRKRICVCIPNAFPVFWWNMPSEFSYGMQALTRVV